MTPATTFRAPGRAGTGPVLAWRGAAGALLAAATALLLAGGCAPRENAKEPANARSEEPHIGLALDVGGRGDRSLNDSAVQGLEEAKEKLGIEYEVQEPAGAAQRGTALRALAGKDLDLIIAVGSAYTADVAQAAAEFPDRRFACVDYSVEPGHEDSLRFNVRAVLFREEEGMFLAGCLAGLGTKTGRIGFVAEAPTPALRRNRHAFEAGIRYANERAELATSYVGSTAVEPPDPARAKELALELYQKGADIVFDAAGASGRGVLEAAVERKKFVIGTDEGDMERAPGLVLACVIKHVDRAVFEVATALAEGTYRGGVTRMGLMSGGLELLFEKPDVNPVPPEVISHLDVIRRQLMTHRIEIPADDQPGSEG